MDSQLDKILKLITRTGDKFIILKDDNEFVVFNLDDYIKLLDNKSQITELSEAELLHKINRDIALWREAQRDGNDFFVDNVNPTYEPLNSDSPSEDSYIVPVEDIKNESGITGRKDNKVKGNQVNYFTKRKSDRNKNKINSNQHIKTSLSNNNSQTDSAIQISSVSSHEASVFNGDKNFSHIFNQELNKIADKKVKSAKLKDKSTEYHKAPSLKNNFIGNKKRINNFGYFNPPDTDEVKNLDKNDGEFETDNKSQLDKNSPDNYHLADNINNYSQIPPPPDAKSG